MPTPQKQNNKKAHMPVTKAPVLLTEAGDFLQNYLESTQAPSELNSPFDSMTSGPLQASIQNPFETYPNSYNLTLEQNKKANEAFLAISAGNTGDAWDLINQLIDL